MVDLNPEQSSAAAHREGPMLVIAGPGTGKTATLAARFARLAAQGIDPGTILCVTFTRNAAQQLKERVAAIANVNPNRLSIGTFHSIARNLIARVPDLFGDLAERRLIGDEESARIIKAIAKNHPVDENEAPDLIAGFKDRLISPTELSERARTASRADAESRLASTYAAYQAHLDRHKLIDFGDLIAGVVAGLRRAPDLAAAVSQRFRYVMVDEYQDINLAQHAFINALLTRHNNLWVVGDDDQALYGWRHADVRYILDFAKNYPGAKTQTLVRNYRSQPVILGAANALIANNAARYRKSLTAVKTGPIPIHVHGARTADAEAEWIAQQVASLLGQNCRPSEIAVLSRVGYHLSTIERALQRHRIPVRIVGAPPFWQQPELRQALSALQTLTKTVIDPSLEPAPRWFLDRIADKRRHNAFLPTASVICSDLIDNPPRRYNEERKAAWRYVLAQLYAEIEQHPTSEALKRRIAAGHRPGDADDAVELCTIHAAKGLEWRAVFLSGAENGVLPHARAEDPEEERRLAFVAVTRAEERLFVSYARERLRKDMVVSPFLKEMLAGVPQGAVVKTEASGVTPSAVPTAAGNFRRIPRPGP